MLVMTATLARERALVLCSVMLRSLYLRTPVHRPVLASTGLRRARRPDQILALTPCNQTAVQLLRALHSHSRPLSSTCIAATSTLSVPSLRRAFHSQQPLRAVHGDPATDSAGAAGQVITLWKQYKPRLVTYMYIGTALFAGVLILRAGLSVVNFFSTLDFADVGQVAFLAGLVTAFGLVAVVSLGKRALTLRPEPVYQDSLRQVLNDVTVRSFLGSDLKPGSFRAYSFVPGALRVPGASSSGDSLSATDNPLVPYTTPSATTGTSALSRWGGKLLQYYRPRRLQLFFQITGTEGNHGMVSAEVEKIKGSMKYNLLCVDVLNSGQRIILKGDAAYSIYQGVIKLR